MAGRDRLRLDPREATDQVAVVMSNRMVAFARLPSLVALALGLAPISVAAGPLPRVQERREVAAAASAVTAEDYARAESLLGHHLRALVFGGTVEPHGFAADSETRGAASIDRFWYRNATPAGTEFVRVDPATGSRDPAFDHPRLAAVLSTAADTVFQPYGLPESAALVAEDALAMRIGDAEWRCDLRACSCAQVSGAAGEDDPDAVVSPDGAKSAFVRDHNLWLRDLATGAETPLTFDGVEDYGYATNNAGWIRRDSPVLLWSPDSKMIATFQHDGRGVGEMVMATTAVGRPELARWKYPLPGDSLIFRIARVVVHVDGPRVVRLEMPPDPHRSTVTDHVAGPGGVLLDTEWSPDGSQLAFVSSSRDHKEARLRIADPRTGVVREVLSETEEHFFESGSRLPNWRVLHGSGEVLWLSKRDNWGHIYRYELATGRLLGRVTTGEWNVLRLLRVDEDERTLYFTGVGREPGDPYFRYLYKIGIDGTGLALLTPDSADHSISVLPSGRYFVDSYSTPVVPPTTVVRDRDGRVAAELEHADISRLAATDWRPPEPFVVKARDGRTNLHGLMYKPSNFDPASSYPVINYVYPGPQSGSVGSRSFRASRGDKQSLAELGFVVVEVDAMGTPGRSKEFHDAYYGDMGDNGLPDQVGMVRQLAERHPWIDIGRVGIWGHSGGGFASAAGILRYPKFYKVAVSQAGNHDNRSYEDDWGEKWQGLLETYPDGTTNYDGQANPLIAENLEGKLLLAHGTMDTNVPVYNTLLLVDALVAADKDFDLIMMPNRGHGFGNEPYMMRRRWDYFVRHLLGVEPPAYSIGGGGRPVSD